MKKKHCFEIVRVTHRRYSWRFVVIEDGRRRVLDRSDRDYRSPKRVRRAIARMQNVPVVDLSRMTDRDLFPLPVGTFRIVNGVLPLVVETSSAEFEPSSRRSELMQPAGETVVMKKDEPLADKVVAAEPLDKPAGKTPAATMTTAEKTAVSTTTTTPAAAKPAAAKAPQAHPAGPATGAAAAKSYRRRKAT